MRLKKCPFCHDKGEKLYHRGQCTIRCSNFRCIAHDIAPTYTKEEDAEIAWNTRKGNKPNNESN